MVLQRQEEDVVGEMAIAKRLLDIIIATIALVLLAPVLGVIAVLIRLDSAGPALYRGVRMGREGRLFHIFKFRTMVLSRDNTRDPIAAPDDTRITKVGVYLRRYKLDELPQFINVLRGEMSIVGPRPESPRYLPWYTDEQKAVFRVRPGITGLAQIVYVDEAKHLARAEDHENLYVNQILPHKLSIDLQYIQAQSLATDFRIIVQTCAILMKLLLRHNKNVFPSVHGEASSKTGVPLL